MAGSETQRSYVKQITVKHYQSVYLVNMLLKRLICSWNNCAI